MRNEDVPAGPRMASPGQWLKVQQRKAWGQKGPGGARTRQGPGESPMMVVGLGVTGGCGWGEGFLPQATGEEATVHPRGSRWFGRPS